MRKMDMIAYRTNRSQRDILEELRRQGRFYEFLFVSWGIVEFRANESILKAYRLSSQDLKSEPLLHLSVGRKLEVLKELGYLSTDEYQTVFEFKKKRNDLFHRGALFILHLSQPEKEKVMDMGMQAADVMHNLSESSPRTRKDFIVPQPSGVFRSK
jgi:hypothetical protein